MASEAAEDRRVVILGGHGKIALLATPQLVADGWRVDALIRDPAHREDVASAGANPVLLDLEQADVDALAEVFSGASAVVFSAGAGGGNPERTRAVDHDAAVRSMEAAEQAGVARYVMVSFSRSETAVDALDPEASFYPYARAKHDADEHLRGAGLDYTILGPGRLTLEPGGARLQLVDGAERPLDGSETPAERPGASRENVAAVIVHVLRTGAASRSTVNFVDGETPIAEAVS